MTAAAEAANGISLRAMRIDLEGGGVDWNNEVFAIGSVGQLHKKNTLASPTALVDGDRVYVHFGPNGTAAMSFDGKVFWRQNQIKYSPVHGGGASPILVDGTLVVSCDGASDPFLLGLDAKSGAVKWKTPRKTQARNSFSFATALAITNDGAKQIVSPTSGFVGGYEPATGRELWRVRYGEGYSVVPRPVFANGMIYQSSGFDRPNLLAIDPKGATGDATETHVKWTIAKGAPNTPSPVVVGNEVYFVSDAGIASCADAKTGATHWSERLGGGFSASPIVAENRIYFMNEAGVATVVEASKTFKSLSTNDLAEKSLASPAAIDNALIIRTEGHLWRIGKK